MGQSFEFRSVSAGSNVISKCDPNSELGNEWGQVVRQCPDMFRVVNQSNFHSASLASVSHHRSRLVTAEF